MDEYNKLREIYEGTVYSTEFTPSPYNQTYDSPNARFGAREGGGPSYSRGAIPGAYPGAGASNTYAMGRVPLNSDEESDPVISKIENLMKTAHEDEMMYAVHMLGELKAYIKDLQESS